MPVAMGAVVVMVPMVMATAAHCAIDDTGFSFY